MMKSLEEVCKLVKAVVWEQKSERIRAEALDYVAVLVQWKDKAWRFKRYREYGANK